MKSIAFYTFFMLSAINALSQNLVGYNEMEIKRYMKENRSDMSYNNVTNHMFKYLKYSDNSDSQTLLFFLNPDSVCHSIRLICDLRVKEDKIKEFNASYEKNGENKWIDKRNGKNYLVELRDEKWSCVVTIEPDN